MFARAHEEHINPSIAHNLPQRNLFRVSTCSHKNKLSLR